MLPYYLNCKKTIEKKNPRVKMTTNGRIMLLWNCTVWNSKKNILDLSKYWC